MHQRGEGNRRFNRKQEFAYLRTSMNVKNTTMSKKNAFVIPSIMAPITKKYNLNTEHKKLANSYYEKEITFDYHKVAEAFISEEISIQS